MITENEVVDNVAEAHCNTRRGNTCSTPMRRQTAQERLCRLECELMDRARQIRTLREALPQTLPLLAEEAMAWITETNHEVG